MLNLDWRFFPVLDPLDPTTAFPGAYDVGLVATSILTHGHTAMWAILAVGLFNSVMFPSIFTVGLSGLGPLTSKGSSLMVAAIVGGALIPLAEGHLADKIGVQHAFVIPAVCYVYIALFGYLGGRRAEREVGLAA